MRTIKGAVRKISSRLRGVNASTTSVTDFSHVGEQAVIMKYLKKLPQTTEKFLVDIGASDGVSMSNSNMLLKKGWRGLGFELDAEKFEQLAGNFMATDCSLAKVAVTPDNITSLLRGFEVPKKFGFLSLDIDGYDYFVLKEILKAYRPSLICAEINEKIPPPIKFTVKYEKGYFWNSTHFFGQSLSQLDELCATNKYDLVQVHYNNAFYIPSELNAGDALDPATAYAVGYRDKADRRDKFPWNEDVEAIYSMTKSQQINFLNNMYSDYKGKYTIKP